MEASVDLSSPKKMPRRHYKEMWLGVCEDAARLEREAKQATDDFYSQVEDTRRANTTIMKLGLDLFAQRTALYRWAFAAIVEAVVLLAIAIILWLR